MKNQTKKSTFKYEQEGRFCLGVAKIESKDETITGKRCTVYYYSGGKIVTVDAYKKKYRENFQELKISLHHIQNG